MSLGALSQKISTLVQRTSVKHTLLLGQPHRWSSYLGSSVVDPHIKYTDVEVSKNPEEWKWVERLLPIKMVPEPPAGKTEFASGWKPSRPNEALKEPYFIGRSRNFMPSVYLKIVDRKSRRMTYIRNIQGDIWKLKEDLSKIVDARMGFHHGVHVNELNGVIVFKGDVYNLILEFFHKKGF